MKTQITALCVVMTFGLTSIAQELQNIVKNDHFTTSKKVTYRSQIKNAEGWTNANGGTVDIFTENACKTNVGIPHNYMGNEASESNYIGFTAYYDDQILSLSKTDQSLGLTNKTGYGSYSEYPQGELITPLEAGETYFFNLKISLADKSGRAVKGLGVYFSKDKVEETNNRALTLTPQVVFDQYFDNKEGWTNVWGKFIAEGGERYFTIGAFEGSFEVKSVVEPKVENDNKRAYYYINGGVRALKFPLTADELASLKRAMDLVHFNTGSDQIKAESFEELDKIAAVLAKYPRIVASIEGHTDNTGGDDLNLRLSKDRAKSVKNYLVKRGVAADRLDSEGYGPDRPIASNDTEEGRAQNRRVVIRTSLYKSDK